MNHKCRFRQQSLTVVPTGANPLSVEVQFVEVYKTRERDSNPAISLFSDEGYISESRIELLARDVLVEAGLTLAETTYVIETSSSGPRQDMTIMSYIAMGVAALLFIIGIYLRSSTEENP